MVIILHFALSLENTSILTTATLTMSMSTTKGLLETGCPEEWIFHDEMCYKFIEGKRKYQSAESRCIMEGGDRVSLKVS